MDTSETYIKMCCCPEIQVKHWRTGWAEGDYFWDGSKVCLCGMDYLVIKQLFEDGRNYVRFAMREPMSCIVWEQNSPCSDISAKIGTYEVVTLNNAIWLPTQSDLQKMVRDNYQLDWKLADEFILWIKGGDYTHALSEFLTQSMEQLWLAFVMKTCHNKKWVNDKWE